MVAISTTPSECPHQVSQFISCKGKAEHLGVMLPPPDRTLFIRSQYNNLQLTRKLSLSHLYFDPCTREYN